MSPGRTRELCSGPKLFYVRGHAVTCLTLRTRLDENLLQILIERNLRTSLGVTFLASEYSTGNNHRGRIDTLGIDESGSPAIIEYKRKQSTNMISQGLFYRDWLLDHRAEFHLLAEEHLGPIAPKSIQWSSTRLIFIASSFGRYDLHAVRQVKGRIDLLRYHWFEDSLLILDPIDTRI